MPCYDVPQNVSEPKLEHYKTRTELEGAEHGGQELQNVFQSSADSDIRNKLHVGTAQPQQKKNRSISTPLLSIECKLPSVLSNGRCGEGFRACHAPKCPEHIRPHSVVR